MKWIVLTIALFASNALGDFNDYYAEVCHVNSNSGQETTRHQFLLHASDLAMKKHHCVVACIKNGCYMYTAGGDLLDDYTPRSKMPRSCSSMNCY